MFEFSMRAHCYRVFRKQLSQKKKLRVDELDSLLGLCLAAVWLVCPPAKAQSNGCDEAVIRLPDRHGTIQICASLARKVPQIVAS
jgi:hypothetical protein